MSMNIYRRALVTGGAGFLGSHLCERLLASGTAVVCLDDLSTGIRDNVAALVDRDDFELIEHDVMEPLPDLPPIDLVCHLATPASPADYLSHGVQTLRVGALGTAHALDAARAHGARFLLASTSDVYGDTGENPQTEDCWGRVNPIGPRSVHDEASRYAEALTMAHHREFGTDTCIARIFTTYGPRMRPTDGRMIPNFVQQALSGRPLIIHGTGMQTRSICYVDDIVRGLCALAAAGIRGPVNLGNPAERTVRDTAELVRRVLGSESPLRHIPATVDDARRRCPDITVARRELGWTPTVVAATGVCSTAEWFTAHTAPAPIPTAGAMTDELSQTA